MKLEDAYLRELMARLDGGGALSDGPATAVVDAPNERREIDRAEAEAALEQRLTSLRQQIAAINGSPSTPNVPPADVSKSTPPRSDVQPPETSNTERAPEFAPIAPNTLEETGLESEEIEAFLLKYLLNRGASAGRTIAEQLGLPFSLMEKVLYTMKAGQLVVQKGSAPLSDYVYQLTSGGLEDARRHYKSSSYFGSLPVTLDDYIASVKAQSIRRLQPTNKELEVVFKDLLVDDELRSRIGQAVHAGKGFFLYGSPGNGKTSVAERVARAFGQYIWIPRAIGIAGEIIRMFDPCNHDLAPPEEQQSATSPIDRRWVRIRRPTVIAGGELTMDRLEIMVNKGTGINEAPLQLKSNCGVLVIDDFGRQRMSVAELLNRWIVPLDRRYDFLNLPSGKTIQVPFDQLLIFSTNLEPRDLVDEAFLRRISYKIEVPDPTLEDFRRLMRMYADRAGFSYEESVIEYLISEHYLRSKRPFRACHARDLLDHVRSFCGFHARPLKMTHEAFDAAVKNYFGLMGGPTK